MAMRGGQCRVDGCTVYGFHCHEDHASAWGHAHAPEPAELEGSGGWRRGLSAVVAVGLRPCSGAIIVLIFALAQDLFWTGVGATLLMGLGTAATVAAIATVAVSARDVASRLAKSRGKRWRVSEFADAFRNGGCGIIDQQAVAAVADDFRQTADATCHHRHPRGHS